MAMRFLRLDLSPQARDFEAIAVEPGLPLLDRSNSHFRIIRKWLGRFIAETEWDGTSVNLFACDDQGGRPQDILCEPIASDDLRRIPGLHNDLEELEKRLRSVKPGPREQKLYTALLQSFDKVLSDSGPSQRENYFYKYHDGGAWRLVWAWGFHRKSIAPGAPTICTNPQCSLLFLRFHDGNRNCPNCEKAAALTARPRRSRLRVLLPLLLIGCLAGAGYYYRETLPLPWLVPQQASFEVSPANWLGQVPGQIEYKIVHRSPSGETEDVSAQVTTVVDNPAVARFDRGTTNVRARSVGKTAVHFYYRDKELHATIAVSPPTNPAKLLLEPQEVALGVGTTVQMRLWGEFADGRKLDLTDAAEWEPAVGSVVSCYEGLLEGLTAGSSAMIARYRAKADDPYLRTEAKVDVKQETYRDLSVDVDPPSVMEQKAARLRASVKNEAGQSRSVLGSSRLTLAGDDRYARIERERLRGIRAGTGKLTAQFEQLSAERSYSVVPPVGGGRFIVTPKELRLVIGGKGEIAVESASGDPVRLESENPKIAAVSDDGTMVYGRGLGETVIKVMQEAREEKVHVEVIEPKFSEIAFVPRRVSVQVEHDAPLRLVGRRIVDEAAGNYEEFDLIEGIDWLQLPTAQFVELDQKTLQLHGRRPTDTSPQTIAAQFGTWRADATIDVVRTPAQIELTPSGPVLLPPGLAAPIHVWVKSGDGRLVEIKSDQVAEWKLEPSDPRDVRFDKRTGTVRAVKGGGESLNVTARFDDRLSKRVEFRPVDAPYSFAVRNDRSLICAGDSGRLTLAVTDLPFAECSVEGAEFQSSNEKVLAVDPRSGAYRATAAGKATVTVKNAKTSAVTEIEVFDREKATLSFRPSDVKLLADGRQSLNLVLSVGEREDLIPLTGDTAKVRFWISNPEAVRWQAPWLYGIRPCEPFEVVAEYNGFQARGSVAVLPGTGKELRIEPGELALAPGQSVSPRVMRRLSEGEEAWQEIDPTKIKWTVPENALWTAATDEHGPQFTVPDNANGSLGLQAEYGDEKTTAVIETKGASPPSGPLVVVGDPPGDMLPVGESKRFAVMVQNGNRQVPAAHVKWQQAFENDWVRWEPPLLSAKSTGRAQRIEATVGEQKASFVARVVGAAPPPDGSTPPPPKDRPSEVRIVADRPKPIVIPKNADFADFRVEAVYGSGRPVNVTSQATLSAEGNSVAVAAGHVVAMQPGVAVVHAEFKGIKTNAGLQLEVSGDLQITKLIFEQDKVALAVGNSASLRLIGSSGTGASVFSIGDITSRPDVKWSSDNSAVVQADGPRITALGTGTAKVTATLDNLTATADVAVTAAAAAPAYVASASPRELQMFVGESKFFGQDIPLAQGVAAVDDLVAVPTPEKFVRFNPANRSLEGLVEGTAMVAVTAGGSSFPISVVVQSRPRRGNVVIEPNQGMLTVGQRLDVHVIQVTDDGQRIDRTGEALFTVQDDKIAVFTGNRISGLAAGTANVEAVVPGIKEPATATYAVADDTITQLIVSPPSLSILTGDVKSFRIEGVGKGGRRAMGDHPDLKITASGEKPNCVELRGTGDVRGVTEGKAQLNVSWRGVTARPVSVEVIDAPPTRLRLDPTQITIIVGQPATVAAYVTRGTTEHPISSADGVQLIVPDSAVAKLGKDGATITGVALGQTTVQARLGTLSAHANISVVDPTPGAIPAGVDYNTLPSQLVGLRFIPGIRQVELGMPASGVRLVRAYSDGRTEDVDHRAEFKIDKPEVVDVRWTASGPVFNPKKDGIANVTARHEGLETEIPFRIEVVKIDKRNQPRLRVRPDPLRIPVGTTSEFGVVQLVYPGGRPPVSADYRLTSANNDIVAIEGKTLRGVAVGTTRVTVAALNVPNASPTYDVAVEVTDEGPNGSGGPNSGPGGGPNGPARLVLGGPSRTNVGATVAMRVELVDASGAATDVSHNGAMLVLDQDQLALAAVDPGCMLTAKRSGTVNLQARYNDLVSNAWPVQIDDLQPPQSLAIEIESQSIAVGETRPYRVLSMPVGGGPPQDVTHLILPPHAKPTMTDLVINFGIVDPAGNKDVAENRPPTVIGRAPGVVRLEAVAGNVRSPQIDLPIGREDLVIDGTGSISGTGPLPQKTLRPERSTITIGVGEPMPATRVYLRTPPDNTPRLVSVKWASEDEAVLAPDAKAPGGYVGVSGGRTRLRGVYEGLDVFVSVAVSGDPFFKVELKSEPIYEPGGRFRVEVEVTGADKSDPPLEYCIVPQGSPDNGEWRSAGISGDKRKVRLTSPALIQGDLRTRYKLEIYARDDKQKTVSKHPLTFTLQGTVGQVDH